MIVVPRARGDDIARHDYFLINILGSSRLGVVPAFAYGRDGFAANDVGSRQNLNAVTYRRYRALILCQIANDLAQVGIVPQVFRSSPAADNNPQVFRRIHVPKSDVGSQVVAR